MRLMIKTGHFKERGIIDGHLVAAALKSQNISIDAVYSSPANRALHTCLIFLRKLNFPFLKFQITNELYDFSGEKVLKFIRSLDRSFNTVLIFGHNEAFTSVVNQCGNSYIDNVPTTGLVQLNFEVDLWSSIKKGNTQQRIFPKDLK